MLFFKKKKKEETPPDESEEATEETALLPEKIDNPDTGDVSLGKLSADVEKLKAQFSTFYEMQKASTTRFSMINEQIGELRAMHIERDKDSKYLEAKAQQAIDLVKTVQPDKLMIDLKKGDAKIDALRAGIESNENIINNVLKELREMRNLITVFRGMEQVVKLNEEVKAELAEIKKVNALVQRHADHVETIFSEMQKKSADFERLKGLTEDLDKSAKQLTSDFDSMNIKVANFASKKEVENLISRFDTFEKHANNILTLMNSRMDTFRREFNIEITKKLEKTDKLLKGFDLLAQKTPDLDQYFNLLSEEAKKVPQAEVKVEKIKEPGEAKEEPLKEPEKKSIFSRMKEVIAKKGS